MNARAEIAGWISTHYGSEALLFNLKLTYPEIMVGGEKKENYSTYSQVKLSFNKAEQILRNPEWGLKNLNNPEQETDIRFELEGKTTEEQRFEVFRTYLELALWIVAERVSLAKGNKRNVKIALNNTTAGILPYQFGEDYNYSRGLILTAPAIPDKVGGKKGKAAAAEYLTAQGNYQKHVQELVKAAQSLWQQKLTFSYHGENAAIRQSLSYSGYQKNIDGVVVTIKELDQNQRGKFLGGLMELFGVGQLNAALSATKANIATGDIQAEGQIQVNNRQVTLYKASRQTVSIAEVLIAIARSSNNILVTKHDRENGPGAFMGKGVDGTDDYTFLSFREKYLDDPSADLNVAPEGSPVPKHNYYTLKPETENLWWALSHELLHIYPIYSSEYKNLPSYGQTRTTSDYTVSVHRPYTPEEAPYHDFYILESPEEDVPTFLTETILTQKNDRYKKSDANIQVQFQEIDLARLTNPPPANDPNALNSTEQAQRVWLADWAASPGGLLGVDLIKVSGINPDTGAVQLQSYKGGDDWIAAWRGARNRAQAFGVEDRLMQEFVNWIAYQFEQPDPLAFFISYGRTRGTDTRAYFVKLNSLSKEFGLENAFKDLVEKWVIEMTMTLPTKEPPDNWRYAWIGLGKFSEDCNVTAIYEKYSKGKY